MFQTPQKVGQVHGHEYDGFGFQQDYQALSSDKRINVSDIKYSRTVNKDTGYAEVEYDEDSLRA